MPNRLKAEISPYLQQHAMNPVDWYPWGPEALARAKQEQKPIFLSIGYSACHWCHVMAHESFENPQIAAILNEHFINIKVDREERPDLDKIYMDAVVAITGRGGWPLNAFLTPNGEPFYGGTYFPPLRRFNMPSFEEILTTISRLWNEDRQNLLQSSQEISAHLREGTASVVQEDAVLDPARLDQAALRLAQAYDWTSGGWGAAPKFPQPMTIEFLLRRGSAGDSLALDTALHALDTMQRGGLHDLIGGGFARYSTDDKWRVPHFEKMLSDNALLARVYLIAHKLTGDPAYAQICRSTLDFLAREMRSKEGGYYSSLDADSEGIEGKYYTWTQQEVGKLLRAAQGKKQETTDSDWAEVFQAVYDITSNGQLEGRNVLQRSLTNEEAAEGYHLPIDEVERILRHGLDALRSQQLRRVRPTTDDKVLVSWNGLANWAFAEAARYLKDAEYLQIARQNAAFHLDHLFIDGQLYRLSRSGQIQQPGFLEDHAALALALLTLYQTDTDLRWYQAAEGLINNIDNIFKDPRGGYFDTQVDETLLLRPKDLLDNATPCGNSLTCRLFGQFGALSGNIRWLQYAKTMAATIMPDAARYPTAYGNWLCAADFSRGPIQEVALLAPTSRISDLAPFIEEIWCSYRPNLVLAAAEYPLEPGVPGLLNDRQLINQKSTAYLCENFTCQQPVNTSEDLAAQLSKKSASF